MSDLRIEYVAEIDAVRVTRGAENWNVVAAFNQPHGMREARTFVSVAKFREVGRALVEALYTYGYPLSDECWRNVGDAAQVKASREVRALHNAAAAFRAALAELEEADV